MSGISNNGINTQISVNRSATKAISMINTDPNVGGENFVLWGSGKTEIKTSLNPTDDVLTITDANSTVKNFAVKNNGFVYAREVIVTLNAFPDYVFEKDYKLMPILDLKTYTEKNKHLPNMPTAKEVADNGASIGEVQRVSVEKIEELYKYIFVLEEELKVLKNRLDTVEKNK